MLRAIVLAALCACGSVSAQEPTPKVRPLPTAELNRLVEQLGSRDYRERERASRTLAEEGDRALPLLKAGLDKTESPEVQRRLEVLIAKLNSERVFRPTTVTVDCKNDSVKTVLKDVCKQAGYKFQIGRAHV